MADYLKSSISVADPDADGNYPWMRIRAGGNGAGASNINELIVKTLHVTKSVRNPIHFLLKQPINASSTAVTNAGAGVPIVFPSANNYSKIISEDFGGHTLLEPIVDRLGFRIPSQVGAGVTIPDLLLKCKLKIHTANANGLVASMLLNSLTVGAGAVPAHQQVQTLALPNADAEFEFNTDIVLPSFVTPAVAVDIDYTLNLLLSGAGPINMEVTGVLEVITF